MQYYGQEKLDPGGFDFVNEMQFLVPVCTVFKQHLFLPLTFVRQWSHIDALITWLTINGNSCCLRLNSPPTVGT